MEKLTTLVLFCLLAIACGGGSGGLDDHDPDSPVMETDDPDSPVMETDDPDSPVMETEKSPKDEVVELFLEALKDDSPGSQAVQNEVREAARSWQGGESCFVVSDYTDFGLWLRIQREFGFRGADIDHSDSSDVENVLENAIDLELDGVETTKEIWERVACKLEPDNCVCWSQIYGADVAPDRGEEYDDSMGVPIPPSPELTAECHTPRELFNFLKESSSDCPYNDRRVKRWEDAPTIRLAEDATDREREMVRLIVDRINLAMPWELKIGKDAPARQLGSPDGEIWVDFAPQAEWAYKSDRLLAGVAVWHPSGTNSHEIARAHVWVIPSDIMGYEDFEYPLAISWAGQYTSYVLAHELLHALGLLCHVQSKWWKQSVMEAGVDEAGIVFRTNVLYHLERNGPAVWHEYYYCNIEGDPYCYYNRHNIPGDIDLDALKALYLHDTGERPNRNDLPGELCEWRTD